MKFFKKPKNYAAIFIAVIILIHAAVLPASAVPDDLPHEKIRVYTHNNYPTAKVQMKVFGERSAEYLGGLHAAMLNLFPSVTPLRTATAKYNCHSYAWYDRSASNIIWIEDVSKFIEDAVEINKSATQPGDIVVYYFDSAFTDVSHSAVVESFSSFTEGGMTLVSKWGEAGVYRHSLERNIYWDYHYARYTKVYRVECKYTKSKQNLNNYYHKETCWCGNTRTVAHSYNMQSNGSANHTKSCACGKTVVEPHSFSIQDNGNVNHKKICACGLVITERHTFVQNGNAMECSVCGHGIGLWNVPPETE